jgi:hypothetical protein
VINLQQFVQNDTGKFLGAIWGGLKIDNNGGAKCVVNKLWVSWPGFSLRVALRVLE